MRPSPWKTVTFTCAIPSSVHGLDRGWKPFIDPKPIYARRVFRTCQLLCPLTLHLPPEYTHTIIHIMSPSATTELGPASGPDVQLKPEETPTYKAPRQHASHEEYQYLDLIRDILEEGEHRPDRYLVLLSSCREISNILFQNWHRHILHLRPQSTSLQTLRQRHRQTDPTPSHHKTRLPPRRHRRTPLVRRRKHLLNSPHRPRHQNLGRQRLPRIPRLSRPLSPRSRRPRPRLRFPMAPLRCRI
jgi:hypothetical protein